MNFWNFNGRTCAVSSNSDEPMRNILIVAGLLAGATLFGDTPAKAELGCTCVKISAPAVCTAGIGDCTLKGGGACILPCDYRPPKVKAKKHRHKAKAKTSKKT